MTRPSGLPEKGSRVIVAYMSNQPTIKVLRDYVVEGDQVKVSWDNDRHYSNLEHFTIYADVPLDTKLMYGVFKIYDDGYREHVQDTREAAFFFCPEKAIEFTEVNEPKWWNDSLYSGCRVEVIKTGFKG